MSERQTICRVCGGALAGRDVFEGICRGCREDEVLGSGARPRKPTPPKPEPKPEPSRPPVTPQVAPPPDSPDIDVDADTKELAVLGDLPPAPEPSAAPAAEDGQAPLTFAGPEAPDSPYDAEAADTGLDSDTEAVALPADAGFELSVIDLVEEEELDKPPAASPPIEPPPPEPRQEPVEGEPAQETPPELRIRLDHPAAEPEPTPTPRPAPADDAPAPPARLNLSPELDARFRTLESRLAELAARLDDARPLRGPAAQVKLGMCLVLGMALAAGLLGALAVGVLALIKLAS